MGILKDIRSGAIRWATSSTLGYVGPILWAALLVIVGLFEGIPLFYILTITGPTALFLFGAFFWGLNKYADWRALVPEKEALVIYSPDFKASMHADADNKLGVNASIQLGNIADHSLSFQLKSVEFYFEKTDGTNRRHAKSGLSGAVTLLPKGHTHILISPCVFIEDLKSEQSLIGVLSLKLNFGKRKLTHSVSDSFRINATLQPDGNFHIRSAGARPM